MRVHRAALSGAVFVLLSLLAGHSPAGAEPGSSECVVLLHGLGRSAGAMDSMADALTEAGFTIANIDYPSRKADIATLAASAVGEGLAACRRQQAARIHFVTHSLGGILVRRYFQNHAAGEAQRVVMLGPPNHGSEVADAHRDAWWFRQMTGKAGQELGTGSDSTPNSLKPVPLSIGIIAGTSSSDPWFSGAIPGEDDGKVSTASTQLDEMKGYIELPVGHTFMMRDDEVIRQAIHFLRTEHFRQAGGIGMPER